MALEWEGQEPAENANLNTCKMEKIFTAEQISEWFTSGTAFANIKLTSDVKGDKKLDEPLSKETRWEHLIVTWAESFLANRILANIVLFNPAYRKYSRLQVSLPLLQLQKLMNLSDYSMLRVTG